MNSFHYWLQIGTIFFTKKIILLFWEAKKCNFWPLAFGKNKKKIGHPCIEISSITQILKFEIRVKIMA